MEFNFNKDINILIGENGSYKSTIIDAIRLLYNLGEPLKEILVKDEDFTTNLETGESEEIISISYEFRGLTDKQKGALYEYLVINSSEDYAKISISYEKRKDLHPKFDFYTGAVPGQKASTSTFEIFKHYYLGALRDSTSDLLSTKKNILGKVIKRTIEINRSEEEFTNVMARANSDLLQRPEVSATKTNINDNLSQIYSTIPQIGLHIEQSKIDYIVKVIKPYLPFRNAADSGLNLNQNSLGYNNLIYIATVLSDMNDRVSRDEIIHYALLIEEPEAHLHPQLQLNLYNFLRDRVCNDNCQLFITTHSPTLTSKTDLEKLFIVDSNLFKCVGKCFENRDTENLTLNNKVLDKHEITKRKNMLERYIDVTKSQMFFAKSLILVEGISEELLFTSFTELEGFRFEELDIELVQSGTSFYPFLLLFNSSDSAKKLNKKISVITDDDRFTDSKNSEYSFDKLILNNYEKLDELHHNIVNSPISNRINNLINFKNGQGNIGIFVGFKTFEYEIAISNVARLKNEILNNFFVKYLKANYSDKFESIQTYIDLCDNTLTDDQQKKIALLLWKIMPSKSEFAQEFSQYLVTNFAEAQQGFVVPKYIKDSFNHIR